MLLKANADFKEFNDYFPCDPDAVEAILFSNGLEGIPGSAEHAPAAQQSLDFPQGRSIVTGGQVQKVGGDGQELLRDINSFMSDDIASADYKVRRLKKWLKNFTCSIDIDRIARLAIRTGSTDVANYLITNQAADLKRKDIVGRSAVFYAIGTRDLAVLDHVANVVGRDFFRVEMARADVDGRTVVHHAATTKSVELVEYCLAMADSDQPTPGNLKEQPKAGPLWLDKTQEVELLIMARWRLQQYRDLPICATTYSYNSDVALSIYHGNCFSSTVFKVDDLQNGSKALGENMKKARERGKGHWLHIPWTNGLMLFAAFKAIEKDIQSRRELEKKHLPSWRYRSVFLRCFVEDSPAVPRYPYLNYWKPDFTFDRLEYLPFKINMADKDLPAFTVFPCLVLRSKGVFTDFRESNVKLRDDIEITHAKDTIHLERSLDEAYYPSLKKEALEARNMDQVVSKECKDFLNNEAVSDSNKPILIVSQFWIWRFDNHLLSAYSVPQMLLKQDFAKVDYTGSSLSNEMDINFWGFDGELSEMVSSESLPLGLTVGLIVAHHVEKFGKPQGDKYPSPLDIFETGVVRIMSDVEAYMAPGSLTDLDVERERQFIHDISDIRNELAMVDDILIQQSEVLERLIAQAQDEYRSVGSIEELPQYQKLVRAGSQLSSYRRRKDKIDADAERISQSIKDQLDLKRTNASMIDARLSQKDAHASLLLSTAVIGFTVITIIFAPIAFMTSLFALPIDGIVKHQTTVDGKSVFSTNYIGKWFVTAELVSIAVTAMAVGLSIWLLSAFGDASDARPSKKDPGAQGTNLPNHSETKDGTIDPPPNKKKALDHKQEAAWNSTLPTSRSLQTPWIRAKGDHAVVEV